MKINQYCSVCKLHLDMEVVPTDDGGDDGVIWLRCPECRGFLPKFSGESRAAVAGDTGAVEPPADLDDLPDGDAADEDDVAPAAIAPTAADVARETIAEYAAALAAADVSLARPYRPTDSYEIGEVVHHLAWDDCGIVVAREAMPGNRRAIKVYFGSVGVVHLIEQFAGGH